MWSMVNAFKQQKQGRRQQQQQGRTHQQHGRRQQQGRTHQQQQRRTHQQQQGRRQQQQQEGRTHQQQQGRSDRLLLVGWRWWHGFVLWLTAIAILKASIVVVAVVDGGGIGVVAAAAAIEDDKSMPTLYTEPHFQPNRNGIVQLFEWRFADIAKECIEWLGPKGYAGIELSPITEHLVLEPSSTAEGATEAVDATPANAETPWSVRYQPISYRIASNLGDKQDFHAMSQACNAAGLRVYVTVVLNHMAAPYTTYTSERFDNFDLAVEMTGSADGNGSALTFQYPAVPYDERDFNGQCSNDNYHQNSDNNDIDNVAGNGGVDFDINSRRKFEYANAIELRNCEFDYRPDLNQSSEQVRKIIQDFLNDLLELGVAGFRVHAAEHMWPQDLQEIFDGVADLNSAEFGFPAQARPLVYLDVNDVLYGQFVSRAEYTHFGLVIEHNFPLTLHTAIWQRDLSSLINWGPGMGFVQHQQSVVFVDTPLQQRSGVINWGTTFRQRRRFVLATAFMLAHPYGRVKLLMSSYRYDRKQLEQGAPVDSPSYDEQDQCENAGGWVCEHRWSPLTAMIELVNNLSPEEDVIMNFQTFGPNKIAFCRGHKAFFVFNRDGKQEFNETLKTCLKVGIYCDIITGGRRGDGQSCLGNQVEVQEEGVAIANVPALSDEVESLKDVDESEAYSMLAIHVGSQLLEKSVESVSKEPLDEAAEAGGAVENEETPVEDTPANEEEESTPEEETPAEEDAPAEEKVETEATEEEPPAAEEE